MTSSEHSTGASGKSCRSTTPDRDRLSTALRAPPVEGLGSKVRSEVVAYTGLRLGPPPRRPVRPLLVEGGVVEGGRRKTGPAQDDAPATHLGPRPTQHHTILGFRKAPSAPVAGRLTSQGDSENRTGNEPPLSTVYDPLTPLRKKPVEMVLSSKSTLQFRPEHTPASLDSLHALYP